MTSSIKPKMTIEELAEAVSDALIVETPSFSNEDKRYSNDISVRRIRDYVSKGIIEKPLKEGRQAFFTPEHYESLLNVRKLQSEGLTDTVLQKLGASSYYASSPSIGASVVPLNEVFTMGVQGATNASSEAVKTKGGEAWLEGHHKSRNVVRPMAVDTSKIQPMVADDGYVRPLTTDDSRIIPLTPDDRAKGPYVDDVVHDGFDWKADESNNGYLTRTLMSSSSFGASLSNASGALSMTPEGRNALDLLRSMSSQGNILLKEMDPETEKEEPKLKGQGHPSRTASPILRSTKWEEIALDPPENTVFLKVNSDFNEKSEIDKAKVLDRISQLFKDKSVFK